MAGAAVRGLSKILRKGLRKSPVLGGHLRKAGLTARRGALRGETLARQARGVIPKAVKQPKKKPIISDVEKGVGIGVVGTLAFQEIRKKQKDAKAKEKEKKEKLKKATEKHEKKTKEKREKHGKPHA